MVLFDFPRDGVEYVRRVGRATRGAHQPGRVTSLLLGNLLRGRPWVTVDVNIGKLVEPAGD